jgi:photosystem II stability/assembly factor-like uncharacterized protein
MTPAPIAARGGADARRPRPGGPAVTAAFASLAAAALAAAPRPASAEAGAFVDPLDSPARASALAARAPLHAVASAGARLVAVGERGHVLWSDDRGATWRQASVPASADLTGVRFASPERGWAVGHGVVLATEDGGRSWVKQLDGRALAEPAPSLLDVWFADERSGFAIGAFDLLLHTDDGGATWTRWCDRTDNPRGLHLYAVGAAAGAVWIVGEQGLVLRLDRGAGRFRAVAAPYAGSFFGVIGTGSSVIAYGMRGRAFRSRDRGASWEPIDTGVASSLTGAAVTPDGRIVMVTEAGQLLVSRDDGASFRLASGAGARGGPGTERGSATGTGPASAVAAAGAGTLVVAGMAGVRVERLE